MHKSVLVFAALAMFAAPAGAAPVAPEYAALQAGAETAVSSRGFRGTVVLFRDGKPVWRYDAGTRDCAGRDPIAAGDRYDMGSITKVFTAATVLRLAERGKLSLDDRLGDWLGDVPADKAGITLIQLIGHESGFPDSLGLDEDYISRRDLLAKAFAQPLLFAPGSNQAYSNLGYSMLAAVIEEATGKPYEQALRDEVLRPAGVRSIGYTNPWPRSADVCGLMEGRPWGSVKDHFTRKGPSWHLVGNGGLLTTPDDLGLWMEALFEGRVLNTDHTALVRARMSRQDRSTPKRDTMGTNGSNNIFSSYYEYWPAHRMGLLVMTSDSRAQKERVVGYFDAPLDALMDALEAR